MKNFVPNPALMIIIAAFIMLALGGCGLIGNFTEERKDAQLSEHRIDITEVDRAVEEALASGGKYIIIEDTSEEKKLVVPDLHLLWDVRYLRISLAPDTKWETVLLQLEQELIGAGGELQKVEHKDSAAAQVITATIGITPEVEGKQAPPVTTHVVTLLVGKPQEPAPKLALIIDDFGAGVAGTEDMLALDLPLTFAVIPFRPFSQAEAQAAVENGFEVLLHLPMQPLNEQLSPGPGAITVEMSPEEIRLALQQALAQIPGAVGVNNHMGSRATAMKEIVAPLLMEVQKHNLFFVDSATTGKSVLPEVAHQLGLPLAVNRLFLDNQRDVDMIKTQLERAGALAKKEGEAVAIGHVHPAMAQALTEFAPEFAKLGVKLVFVSQLVK
ncbi:MAG: divergent polysaccharide deacetylase family protein [bacterium]|jgi:polysaccharide deacetylase 2 family uncharacterized protein YibQ